MVRFLRIDRKYDFTLFTRLTEFENHPFRFPPPTQYVSGWPIQLWEGLIANIDGKAYLYAMVHGGTYNVRAFSSLIGETFFSELVLNDKRGQGTVSATEFAQYIGHSTEQLQIRLDQDRLAFILTAI